MLPKNTFCMQWQLYEKRCLFYLSIYYTSITENTIIINIVRFVGNGIYIRYENKISLSILFSCKYLTLMDEDKLQCIYSGEIYFLFVNELLFIEIRPLLLRLMTRNQNQIKRYYLHIFCKEYTNESFMKMFLHLRIMLTYKVKEIM